MSLLSLKDIVPFRAGPMYAIVQVAKLNGVNPEACLRNALARIARGPDRELMFWRAPVREGI
jgi:hypothetical protein